ncbi:MAG: hypothetical protein KDD35_05730 [Bdellovibrionales bacterium]|nr:hypothetical protein [Bdellovibrionales bacterium]
MNAFLFSVLVVGFGLGYQAFSQDDDHKKHHPNAKAEGKTDSKSDMGAMCPDGMASCPMMGEGCPMMQGEQAEMMHGMMHSDKVDLNVAEIDDGVIIKWTSNDKDVAKKLKAMAQQMKKMHPMMKGHMGNAMNQEMMKKKMQGMNNDDSSKK